MRRQHIVNASRMQHWLPLIGRPIELVVGFHSVTPAKIPERLRHVVSDRLIHSGATGPRDPQVTSRPSEGDVDVIVLVGMMEQTPTKGGGQPSQRTIFF